jgi:hypothetical protein
MIRIRRVFSLLLALLFSISTAQLSWLVTMPLSVVSASQGSACPFHGGNCCCLEMCRTSKRSGTSESCHLKPGFSSDLKALQRPPAHCSMSSGCKTTNAFIVAGLINFLPVFSDPLAFDPQPSYLTCFVHAAPLSGDVSAPFRPPRDFKTISN